MAEAKEVKNSFTFVKGFITEASGLNFPEDASLDEENYDLFKDGSRRKRLGIEITDPEIIGFNRVLKSDIDQIATSSFLWEGAGESGTFSLLVVQRGNLLRFTNAGGPDPGFVEQFFQGGTPKQSGAERVQFSYTSSGNRLYVTSSHIVPFYVKILPQEFPPVKTNITLEVRDLDGIDEGLENDFRPSFLTNTGFHQYNLVNQGWTTVSSPGGPFIFSTDDRGTDVREDAHSAETVNSVNDFFPSNSDIFSTMRLSTADSPKAVGSYWPGELKKLFSGNTKAPRGHYVLDAFNKVRINSNFPDEVIVPGPDAVAFYAGRHFHAQGSKVYFSQVIVEDAKIGKCFQEADPTAEDVNALVESDGGELTISEASSILQLVTFSDKLVVFAKNGVWSIDGADASFSATNIRVTKITDTGVVSSKAAIHADDSIFYTASSGIYVVSYNSATGLLSSQNISQTTIQTFYTDNMLPGVLTIKGKYDRLNKKVFWLFNNGDSLTRYYNILVLDVVLGAFSKYRIGTLDGEAPFITDFQESSDTQNIIEEFNVITSNGDQVITSSSDIVIAEADRNIARTSIFNFLVFSTPIDDPTMYSMGSASFQDLDLIDWGSSEYEAFMDTGYSLSNDLIRKKQSPIIQVAFNRTEGRFVDNGSGGVEFDRPSSCLLTASWDWSDNAVSGKVGREQEVYRFRRAFLAGSIGEVFDDGLPIVTTRTKLRGKGRAISLRFRSPAGKDCQLLGWAILNAGNTTV